MEFKFAINASKMVLLNGITVWSLIMIIVSFSKWIAERDKRGWKKNSKHLNILSPFITNIQTVAFYLWPKWKKKLLRIEWITMNVKFDTIYCKNVEKMLFFSFPLLLIESKRSHIKVMISERIDRYYLFRFSYCLVPSIASLKWSYE